MPELPEVETVKTCLQKQIVGKQISSINMSDKKLRIAYPKNLKTIKNSKISGVVRRAKYILIAIEDKYLVIHLGMSGKILFSEDKEYEKQKHDHFILEFSDNNKMIFNDARRFGLVTLLEKHNYTEDKLFKDLGPEPLEGEFNSKYLKKKLENKTIAIKQAIMTNNIVVGVGNIYACEALFMSGINPKTQSNKLSEKKLKLLIQNIEIILKKAIKSGGSTLRDYVRSDGDIGYFQFSHKVYGREKQACFNCGSEIKRLIQQGRSTFYCIKCQK